MTNADFNAVKSLLSDPTTYATTLVAILTDRYGFPSLVEWEPETLILQIKDDYNVDMPTINRDKVWALITAMSTDLFYTSPETFIYVCLALSGETPNFAIFDPPDLGQMAWGITEVLLNDSDRFTPNPDMFSDEVRRFIGVMLDYYAIDDPPDVLAIAIKDSPTSDKLIGQEDDPVMLKAVWQKNRDAADDIRIHVGENLFRLIEELNRVPLDGRDVKEWGAFYEKASAFLTQIKGQLDASNSPV